MYTDDEVDSMHNRSKPVTWGTQPRQMNISPISHSSGLMNQLNPFYIAYRVYLADNNNSCDDLGVLTTVAGIVRSRGSGSCVQQYQSFVWKAGRVLEESF